VAFLSLTTKRKRKDDSTEELSIVSGGSAAIPLRDYLRSNKAWMDFASDLKKTTVAEMTKVDIFKRFAKNLKDLSTMTGEDRVTTKQELYTSFFAELPGCKPPFLRKGATVELEDQVCTLLREDFDKLVGSELDANSLGKMKNLQALVVQLSGVAAERLESELRVAAANLEGNVRTKGLTEALDLPFDRLDDTAQLLQALLSFKTVEATQEQASAMIDVRSLLWKLLSEVLGDREKSINENELKPAFDSLELLSARAEVAALSGGSAKDLPNKEGRQTRFVPLPLLESCCWQ
jgi:hypothetical protein